MPERLARGTLSRDVLLDAAERVLSDPNGPGLTMRALAAELGADPTAVYRHFRNRDALLGALADRLLAGIAEPADAQWRGYLRQLGLALHDLLAARPGAVAVLAHSPFTPTALALVERTMAALQRRGLPPGLAAEALQAVVAAVLGHAIAAAADPEGFWSGLADSADGAQTPATAAAHLTWELPVGAQVRSSLELLLDGVAGRAAAAGRGGA